MTQQDSTENQVVEVTYSQETVPEPSAPEHVVPSAPAPPSYESLHIIVDQATGNPIQSGCGHTAEEILAAKAAKLVVTHIERRKAQQKVEEEVKVARRRKIVCRCLTVFMYFFILSVACAGLGLVIHTATAERVCPLRYQDCRYNMDEAVKGSGFFGKKVSLNTLKKLNMNAKNPGGMITRTKGNLEAILSRYCNLHSPYSVINIDYYTSSQAVTIQVPHTFPDSYTSAIKILGRDIFWTLFSELNSRYRNVKCSLAKDATFVDYDTVLSFIGCASARMLHDPKGIEEPIPCSVGQTHAYINRVLVNEYSVVCYFKNYVYEERNMLLLTGDPFRNSILLTNGAQIRSPVTESRLCDCNGHVNTKKLNYETWVDRKAFAYDECSEFLYLDEKTTVVVPPYYDRCDNSSAIEDPMLTSHEYRGRKWCVFVCHVSESALSDKAKEYVENYVNMMVVDINGVEKNTEHNFHAIERLNDNIMHLDKNNDELYRSISRLAHSIKLLEKDSKIRDREVQMLEKAERNNAIIFKNFLEEFKNNHSVDVNTEIYDGDHCILKNDQLMINTLLKEATNVHLLNVTDVKSTIGSYVIKQFFDGSQLSTVENDYLSFLKAGGGVGLAALILGTLLLALFLYIMIQIILKNGRKVNETKSRLGLRRSDNNTAMGHSIK